MSTGAIALSLSSCAVAICQITEPVLALDWLEKLQQDRINPVDACKQLNRAVLAATGLQLAQLLLMLGSGRLVLVALQALQLAYTTSRVAAVRRRLPAWSADALELYDSTAVFDQLERAQKEAYVKLAVSCLAFFLVLFEALSVALNLMLPSVRGGYLRLMLHPAGGLLG